MERGNRPAEAPPERPAQPRPEGAGPGQGSGPGGTPAPVGTGGGPSKVAVPGGGGVAGEDEKTYDLDQLDFDNAEFEDLGGGRSRTTVPVRDPETGEVIDHVTYEEQAVGDVSELEPGQTATRIDHANQRLYEETTEGTKITNLTTGESVFLPRGSRGGE